MPKKEKRKLYVFTFKTSDVGIYVEDKFMWFKTF